MADDLRQGLAACLKHHRAGEQFKPFFEFSKEQQESWLYQAQIFHTDLKRAGLDIVSQKTLEEVWNKAISCASRLINRRHRDASFDDSIEGNKEHNVNEANICLEILELQSFEKKYDVEKLIEAPDDYWIDFYLQKHQGNI